MVVDHAYECVSKIRGEKNTSKNRSKNVHIQLVIAIGIIMSRTFQTFFLQKYSTTTSTRSLETKGKFSKTFAPFRQKISTLGRGHP